MSKLEFAVKSWIENNSSDTYDRKLHKVNNNGVFDWEYATCPKPTMEQLNGVLGTEALDIAKAAQKDKIERQFKSKLSINSGVETTVLDLDTLPIVFSNGRDDVVNLKSLLELMSYDGIANVQIVDFNGKKHTLSYNNLEKAYYEILRAKLQLNVLKDTKEALIDAATTVEEVEAINFE